VESDSGTARGMSAFNYFNYFTEIEEYFWTKRGAHLLVSPLDWAILETWQKAGIPAATVMRGIDRAFESYARSRRGQSGRQMTSLTYCVEAVLDAAEEEKEAAAGAGPDADSGAARETKVGEQFSREELKKYFSRNVERIEKAAAARAANSELAARIGDAKTSLVGAMTILDSPGVLNLEDLERRLTVIEEKLMAALSMHAPEELMLRIQRELDRQLAAYRSKMTGDQIAALGRRYRQKRLFEEFGVPRLSLFYLT
jgi:hypothetical protein